MFNPYNPTDPYNNSYQNPYNNNFRMLFGCASMILGALMVLASIIWLLVLRTQDLVFVPDLQSSNLTTESFKPGLMLLGAIVLGIIGLYLALGTGGRRVVGKIFSVIITIGMVVAIGATLFYSIFINPNIDMTRAGFTRTSVTINTGDTLHFKNAADGVTQVLCIGVDQQCKTDVRGAPEELLKGMLTIAPGQTVDVTFFEIGYYTLTSKNTPRMNIAIHVKHSSH